MYFFKKQQRDSSCFWVQKSIRAHFCVTYLKNTVSKLKLSRGVFADLFGDRAGVIAGWSKIPQIRDHSDLKSGILSDLSAQAPNFFYITSLVYQMFNLRPTLHLLFSNSKSNPTSFPLKNNFFDPSNFLLRWARISHKHPSRKGGALFFLFWSRTLVRLAPVSCLFGQGFRFVWLSFLTCRLFWSS